MPPSPQYLTDSKGTYVLNLVEIQTSKYGTVHTDGAQVIEFSLENMLQNCFCTKLLADTASEILLQPR